MKHTSNLAAHRTQRNARLFALGVLALAFGMIALAVAAKTLHYSARTAQTRYFSSSVKMANFDHRQAPSVRQVAVLAPLVRIEKPGQIFTEYVAPVSRTTTLGKSGPQQLRSPPVSS